MTFRVINSIILRQEEQEISQFYYEVAMEKQKCIEMLLEKYGRDCAVFIVSVSRNSVSGQGEEYTGNAYPYLEEIIQHFFEQKGIIEKIDEHESIVLIPEKWEQVKCSRYSRCLQDSIEYLLSLKGILGKCRVENHTPSSAMD